MTITISEEDKRNHVDDRGGAAGARLLFLSELKLFEMVYFNIPYGRFHRGREMTTIELVFFCFAVKTPN